MRFRVTTSSRAEADLDEMLTYLVEHSPAGAAAWAAAYDRALVELESTADGCGFGAEDALFDRGIRQKIFKTKAGLPYRVVFIIRDDEARILRLRGPGQRDLRDSDLGE